MGLDWVDIDCRAASCTKASSLKGLVVPCCCTTTPPRCPFLLCVAEDESYLLVAETFGQRLLRHWLTGPRAGSTEARCPLALHAASPFCVRHRQPTRLKRLGLGMHACMLRGMHACMLRDVTKTGTSQGSTARAPAPLGRVEQGRRAFTQRMRASLLCAGVSGGLAWLPRRRVARPGRGQLLGGPYLNCHP